MTKFRILGIALVAVFAFGAVLAASASAATFLLAEWLVGGAAVTTELTTEATGELLLEDTKVPLLGKAVVLCSGIFDGWVGPNSLGWISEVLTLAGAAVSNTVLSGQALECTGQTSCETNTVVLVWPIGLPSETEVELLEQTGGPLFEVSTVKNQGFYISSCLVLGISAEDECTSTGGAVAELTLSGTSLVATASTAIVELNGGELGTCKNGGSETSVTEGSGTYAVSGGGELTASSETSTS